MEIVKVSSFYNDNCDSACLYRWFRVESSKYRRLSLFKAKTEEELKKIRELGDPIMEQAIEAYRQITTTNEFKELERLRSRARHDEASALGHVRREVNKKWEKKHAKTIAEKDAELAEKDAIHVEIVAKKDAENERLRAPIAELQAHTGER